MDMISAIEQRRSVKHYDSEHEIPQEDVERLLKLAMLSPTAYNLQNWRFVVVKDPAVRKQRRSHAWDQAQVTEASLLIVMCADLQAWDKDADRYWRLAPPDVRQALLGLIHKYYDGKEQVQRDEAMRSCGIAAQTIMLAAKAMGYDSCPMDGFDFEQVASVINLPEDHVIAMMIAVGKKRLDARPRSGPLDLSDVMIVDRFA